MCVARLLFLLSFFLSLFLSIEWKQFSKRLETDMLLLLMILGTDIFKNGKIQFTVLGALYDLNWTVRDWKINWKFEFFDKRLSCRVPYTCELVAVFVASSESRAVVAHLQPNRMRDINTHTHTQIQKHRSTETHEQMQSKAEGTDHMIVCARVSDPKVPTTSQSCARENRTRW